MLNPILLTCIKDDGSLGPDTDLTVQIYAYHASDTAGTAPNGALIGACPEQNGSGTYIATLAESQKVTVVCDGLCRAGFIGVLLDGEAALDGSIDTTAIADGSITPAKTTFAEDF